MFLLGEAAITQPHACPCLGVCGRLGGRPALGARVGPVRELPPTQELRGNRGREGGRAFNFIFFNGIFGGWSKYWNFSLSLCQLSACGKLPSGINVL